MLLRYYDPEYDRVVDENTVRNQYNIMKDYLAGKTFERFAEDNFPRDFRAMSYLYFENKKVYSISDITDRLHSWLNVEVHVDIVDEDDKSCEVKVITRYDQFNLLFDRVVTDLEMYYQISPICRHC